MLKIIKRSIPLETEGTINRLSAELAEARGEGTAEPFAAENTYRKGEYIVHNGRVFISSGTIVAGEVVVPGYNAVETTMESIINQLQKE